MQKTEFTPPRTYFSSYKFEIGFPIDVGLPWPFTNILGINFGYHVMLKEAQEAINSKSTVIGISVSWWGMYSITLAPAHVLKFDPIFNATIFQLVKLASTVSTEKQQTLYNDVIKSFGTHYVSGVVVGALATTYTFIDKEFHSKYDSNTVKEQISLGFELASLKFSADIDGGERVREQMMQEFITDAQSNTTFLPVIQTLPGQFDWNVWSAKASQEPAVINRTLVSLSNLLSDYPEVKKHLQDTIDCYLKTGILPTLKQLNKQKRIKKRNVFLLIDGIDIVGCGYNIFTLESKTCLLDMSISDGNTWTDPFNRTLTYQIPNNFFLISTSDSLSITETVQYDSFNDLWYKNFQITEKDSDILFGLFSHYERSEIDTTYRKFNQYYYNLALTVKEINWYKLSASIFPSPNFNSITQLSFDKLPHTFDPENISKWEQFFDSFGTHIVMDANMGGLILAEIWYESCLLSIYSAQWIKRQIETRNLWLFKNTYTENTAYENTDRVFQQYSQYNVTIIGGMVSSNLTELEKWIPTVKHNPRPITYRLTPIYTLLPQSSPLRNALKNATLYFHSNAVNRSQIYIEHLSSVHYPPPLTCVPQKRKKRAVSKNNFNLTEAREALCPVVGYKNAHYCPGVNETTNKKRRKRTTPVPPDKLPRGVGMTIDISTGIITLPALQLTYSDGAENLWTDSYSKQPFIIPNEVLLKNVSEDENKPTVRIFKTEMDLVNVWTRNADDGYWTVLNKYAKAAITGLTQVYHEEIYTSFMDVWGTHLAVSTEIGGMKEQQTTLKKCIWSSPYFTGGMSIDEIEKNLKEDLLSQSPCNSYYLSRRKLAIDHLVGGNIEIQDIELWTKTIALDPALLKVIKYIPWYDVISDVNIKKNLRKAMTIRINASNIARMSEVDQITSQRTSLLQRLAQYGVRTNYYGADKPAYEIGDRITLGDTHQCPDGLSKIDLEKYCNTGKNVTACSVAYVNFEWTTTWDVPLCYERNRTTGSFRVVARRVAGEILSESEGKFRNYDITGPWIESGCSWLQIPCKGDGRGITDAFICAGCIPTTDREKKSFSCSCPAYETDEEFKPYCK
ncbi:unnamed protein product [Didymodactylos carnosus]|uniref:MACPF domain-containing protein n=1 Tax=Didymodactylos carnosus TaxID=1234261 RepID=A0A815HCZ8_9BILA|nr:unnamed protein product [Didymodactylos carnosus]CAF4219461.1 unnamed protein product [Didymodactylos carnosus]